MAGGLIAGPSHDQVDEDTELVPAFLIGDPMAQNDNCQLSITSARRRCRRPRSTAPPPTRETPCPPTASRYI
jgi:hypothetical protein